VKDYEIVYIFDSALEEPAITEKLDRFHALIAGEGAGEVTEVDHWGRRPLAYPIADKENGYYVVVHANTPADRLPEFERLLQLDEGLLRYLIVINEDGLSTSPAPIVESSDDEDGADDEEA
jgi:small subunit ribosomal protein S6